jgi:GDPmannose 4,6-dehydratase
MFLVIQRQFLTENDGCYPLKELTMSNNKVALCTGITGQDGSYLAKFLLDKDYRVIGMKRRTSLINTKRLDDIDIFNHPNFKLEYGNMTDSSSIYSLLAKYKPDEIYNLAAQSHVRVSFEVPEETLDVVGAGTLKLLEAYRLICPQARFYQASSSEMYGDNPEFPQNEETRMTPASPYAASKLLSHNLCRNYRESYGLHISSGILFNHESPRRGETFVTRKITLAAARIKMGLQDKLYLGNLDAKRDWGHARDYVEAMWMMLQQSKADDYVIATAETRSVKEFLYRVFDLAKLDVNEHVEIDSRLFRPHEVPHLEGDYSKAKKTLGWTPRTSFIELCTEMYESDLEIAKKELLLSKK